MMKGRVIIIGAGVSGLYAAALLEKSGADYLVLEARKRTGGRVLSCLVPTGMTHGLQVDMGATWFWPEIQPDFARLIDRLGLTKIAQGRAGDMLYERQHDAAPDRYPAYQSSPASFRLTGGMQALTAALENQIPEYRIKSGHQAISVSRTGSELQVKTRSESGENSQFSCEHVFLALPPALAAKLEFSPALPDEIISGWQKVPTWMAPHAKYVALYKTDFLRTQNLSGDASSRVGPMVEIHDVSELDSDRTAIFGFIGIPAQTRAALSEPVLRQLCREQLVRLFGQDAASPDADFIKDWAADPFTATESDLLQEAGHPLPDQISLQGSWADNLTGIGSEWSPQFPGYLAGAIEAASAGVGHWLQPI